MTRQSISSPPGQDEPAEAATRPGGVRQVLRLPAARKILAVTLVDSVGTGIFIAGSALFLSQAVHLSNEQIGLGLSVAGLVGFVTTVPVSALGNRMGARRLLTLLMFWRAGGFLAYAFIENFAQFLAIAVFISLGDRVASPVLQALVGSAVDGPDRVTTMALVRTIRNAGFTAGALLAAAALVSQSTLGYRMIALGNAGSFLLAGIVLVLLRLPATTAPVPPGRRFGYLRDVRYLWLALLNGLLSLHMTLLTVGIPLWYSQRTELPQAWIPLLLGINMVLAVLFQTTVAGMAATRRGAGRSCLLAGLTLAVACLLFAVSGRTHGLILLMCVAVGGVVALTAGELLQSAGAWELSYTLAPEAQRSAYLGVFSLGVTGQQILGPSLFGSVVLVLGGPGWLILAAVFVVAGVGVYTASVGRRRRGAAG